MSRPIAHNVHPLSLKLYGLPNYPRGIFRATHKQMIATDGMLADPCSLKFNPRERARLIGLKACRPYVAARILTNAIKSFSL